MSRHRKKRQLLEIEAMAGIDEADFDEIVQADPFEHAPSRRSDRELKNLLSILDSIPQEGGTDEA